MSIYYVFLGHLYFFYFEITFHITFSIFLNQFVDLTLGLLLSFLSCKIIFFFLSLLLFVFHANTFLGKNYLNLTVLLK